MDSTLSSITNTSLGEFKVNASKEMAEQKYSQAEKAEKGLKDFQGLIVGIMLSSMRSTIQKSETFNGGQGEEIFEGMLDQEYSKKMASTDMMGIDKVLRKSFHLPLNESFNWKQVEKLSDESLKNIDQQLSAIPLKNNGGIQVNDSLSAKVSKKLDDVVKKRDLLEQLPYEEVGKLDPEYLKKWKEKRGQYLDSKGVNDGIGPGLKELNKELLQKIFGDLNFTELSPVVSEKRKAILAYNKTTQGLK